MSKDEPKYGFKDKQKAEDSLQLLAQEELGYQKLTVRGLLGRARKVLSMTKNAEKVQNITEAIEVYDKWLQEHSPSEAATKAKKPGPEDKPTTVPGLSYKDKEAAVNTLKIMEGRDPEYQRLSVSSLITSAKRTLTNTKNPDKKAAINAAIDVFREFLDKYTAENRSQLNRPYLPCTVLEKLPKPDDKLVAEFVKVYVDTINYKMLRTIAPEENESETHTWDIVRNKELAKLSSVPDANLFNSDGSPTDPHLAMIYWAYSPQPNKVKQYYESLGSTVANKRKSGDAEETSPAKKRRC